MYNIKYTTAFLVVQLPSALKCSRDSLELTKRRLSSLFIWQFVCFFISTTPKSQTSFDYSRLVRIESGVVDLLLQILLYFLVFGPCVYTDNRDKRLHHASYYSHLTGFGKHDGGLELLKFLLYFIRSYFY